LKWEIPGEIVGIPEVSEMKAGEAGVQKPKSYGEARALLDEAWERATKAYKVAKEQADIVHEEAKKMAVDKEARKRADEAHKEAVNEAKKVRDSITYVAQAVFTDSWTQREKAAQDAIAESKGRSDLAKKVYKEAREQADIDRREARKQAVDSQAKTEADAIHKEAGRQAKQDYDDAMKE
jgi:colicin import membrane protein